MGSTFLLLLEERWKQPMLPLHELIDHEKADSMLLRHLLLLFMEYQHLIYYINLVLDD